MSQAPSVAPIDLSDVRAAIADMARAEDELTRAKAGFEEARRLVAGALADAFEPYREGRAPLPDGLVRELYWHWDAIRVSDLARALKTSPSGVADLAGPITVTDRCERCGVHAEGEKRTRSAHVSVVCHPCTEERTRVEEEARQQLEVREAVRSLVAEWEREGQLPYRHDRYDGRW